MNKHLKRLAVLLLLAVFALPSGFAYAEASNYTYNYDWWLEQVASPDAYYVTAQIMGRDFGIGNFKDAQGLFIRDNRIYICDSGNNRIVVVEALEDGNYRLQREISSVVIDGNESAFNYPMDIYETDYGHIFLCDTKNQRILHLDENWEYISTIGRPEDESMDAASDFLPAKLVVDSADRIYVQATNINKGLLEYDSTGTFTGFMGANKVSVNPMDYLWKKFATKEQRAQMELFVPTEYNNLCIDYDGFIYTTTSTFDEANIKTANPVRRLNSMGTDILVRNGYEPPYGDIQWGNAGGISGASKFVDVVALENDSYCCLDKTRGRLFLYDFQGNLLYAFGGIGNKAGYFLYPTAIEEMGYSLFVLDAKTGAVTRFDLTEYGNYINQGLSEYKKGRYDESAAMWEKVLNYNGNYDLAYIGIGRAALRQGDYKKAMKYFEVKRDSKNYGKAFQLYRKQWMEENIGKLLAVALVLILLPKTVRLVNKVRKEVKEE